MQQVILYQTDTIEIGLFAVNPHEPSFFETGYVESPIIVFPKNSIWIQHTGSEPFVADPTLVNFYNKGQSYHRAVINQNGDYCHWFKISEQLLSEVVCKDQRHFSAENMLCPAAVFLLHVQVLQQVMTNQQPDSLAIEEQVLLMFHELLSQRDEHNRWLSKKQARHKLMTESVKESLHADLSANLSLQQLSKMHHTSPYHLSRVFKCVTGQGINQYRTQQRLRLLTLDLQQNQVDLVDLAFEYGFSSHSHMSACFKQSFGLTPSACQKQIHN